MDEKKLLGHLFTIAIKIKVIRTISYLTEPLSVLAGVV